jgi:hypothetical protein
MRVGRSRHPAVVAAVAVTLSSLASTLALAGPVRAEAMGPSMTVPPNAEHYCVIFVDQLRPGASASWMTQQRCSTDAEALASYTSARNEGEHLMTWYSAEEYLGSWSQIWGNDGTCDRAGYGLRNMGTWNDRVRSYRLHGACSSSVIFEDSDHGGRYAFRRGDVADLGERWHRRISSMRLWSR